MWPRIELDIEVGDLAFGVRSVLARNSELTDADIVGDGWIPLSETLVSLSVRTGFDLLLAALRLPAGSEIIMSDVTITDMVRIVEHHDLVPVQVPVSPERLEPAIDEWERRRSSRTRAIMVAHLFGSRIDMEPVVRFARENNLAVIEDCAQAFVGRGYAGHAHSDCCLFSFGPIKTATALGGAVLRIRDPKLHAEMATFQRAYPLQSRRSYAARLAKYAVLSGLSTPRIYGFLVGVCRAVGIDYDRAFGNAAHAFGTRNLFAEIRHRPCAALRLMLQRRIATFAARGMERLRGRTERGAQLAGRLPAGTVLGTANRTHTYWVLPVRVANPATVVAALRRAGFDATTRSSMVVVRERVDCVESRASPKPPYGKHWLEQTIYLPSGRHMRPTDVERMARLIGEAAEG